jgi:predicted ABC-type exoprotein transport system permease subunit
MFRQGPIPAWLHGAIEYVAAALLIAAPFLFSFEEDAATAASIVVGVIVLVVTACSALPTGIIKSIPVHAHAVVDYVLAIVLIAAPFIFGFTDDGTATAFFIVLGVVYLLLTIATRFVSAERERPRQARRRES